MINGESQVPLLTTKFFLPPARPDVVRRPRLTELLNECMSRQLTLISAPAGFGKTTLLGEWIPNSPRCVTWVSLDKGDNDPMRFWSYAIAALQMLRSDLGKSAQTLLYSPHPPTFETILTNLPNEISVFPDVFALVLDDYHVIETRPIHEGLAFLLEHLPRNMHVIITSRADPPLPLARLRARRELAELRAQDLRFSIAESTAFLNEVMKIGLDEKEVAALEQRTEGWIAGLQIAALSMQGRDDISTFIQSFTGDDRYILDYLVEEVFQRQPGHIQDFLLQTSILNRLCGPLCDAILFADHGSRSAESQNSTRNPQSVIRDSQAILEHLERANLFIVPLDDKRQWYRYHHLFADRRIVREARAYLARFALVQGNSNVIEKWPAQFELPEDGDIQEGNEIEYLTLARLRFSQTEYEVTTRLLQHLQQAAERDGRIGSLIECLALEALAQHAQRELEPACIAVANALALAEPEGFVRVFVDEGAPMAELLRQFVKSRQKENSSSANRPLQNYAIKLLAAFPPEQVPAAVQTHKTSAGLPASYLVDPLSERELQILKLVAEGLSNQEIGRKLFVATSTVKRHMNNIYAKLDVHSRTQAVAKGKELKLLFESE